MFMSTRLSGRIELPNAKNKKQKTKKICQGQMLFLFVCFVVICLFKAKYECGSGGELGVVMVVGCGPGWAAGDSPWNTSRGQICVYSAL